MDPWLSETLLDVVAAILMGVVVLWVLQGLFHAFGSGPARPATLTASRPSLPPPAAAAARPGADPPTARPR
jgi:hypothetical protein